MQDATGKPAQSRGLVLVVDRIDAPRVEIPADMPGPKDQTCKTFKVWANYAMAYRKRYLGAWPVWNAKVGGQLGQLVDRLGADVAHHVAAHYLKTNDAAVLRKCHSLNELLANAELPHPVGDRAARQRHYRPPDGTNRGQPVRSGAGRSDGSGQTPSR